GLAVGLVVFFWWGLPLLAQIADRLHAPVWLSAGLRLFAFSASSSFVFAGPRFTPVSSPWLNLLATHLLGWLFVGLATFYLPRGWQDAASRARWNLRTWWRNLSLGKPAVRVRIRRTLLERNPFLWLAARERFRSLGIWFVTAIIGAVGL